MGLFKRKGIWWTRFTCNRKQVRQSTKLKDKKLAEQYDLAFQAACLEGRFNPSRRDATISDVLNRYLEIHLKPNRPASYGRATLTVKQMISYFGETTPVSRIRPLVDNYKAWCVFR